ncbi:MAG: hypothetical protein WA160_15040 [Pseudobdellovibrio sp.]
MKLLFMILTIITASLSTWAHGDGESRISIEPENQGTSIAGTFKYSFQLYDDSTRLPLGDKDLIESHTKILHMLAYDSSRNEFNHVHPTFDGKVWSTDLNFLSNGNYFVWAQGTLTDGTEFSTLVKAQIINGSPALPVMPLTESLMATDQHTTLELDKTKIKAGIAAMINYKVSRDDGTKPLITSYLGALAHIVAVSPDGDELIHVHPMAGGTPDSGMIHVTFPIEGDYRIWIQLIDQGVLKTIPLAITVLK